MNGLTAAGADFAATAADDMSVDSVEVKLPAELSAEIRQLAADNGWPEEEAFLTVLTYGLNFLKQHPGGGYDEPGIFRDANVDQIKVRLVQLESLYAAMKFRAFTLKRDNNIFDIRDQALAIENNALRAAVEELSSQKQFLRERCRQALSDEDAERLSASTVTQRLPPLVETAKLRDLRFLERQAEGAKGRDGSFSAWVRDLVGRRRGQG